jgi:hypothetical protein
MIFLNHREWGVALSVFLLSPSQFTVMHYINCRRLREFEEIEISMQSCRGDSELQKEKLIRRLSGFRPRIRPLHKKMEYDPLEEVPKFIFKGMNQRVSLLVTMRDNFFLL